MDILPKAPLQHVQTRSPRALYPSRPGRLPSPA